MPDWNLALIDVVCAWVVVALPRYVQARVVAQSGQYSWEAQRALGIDERLSIDPVKHTSLVGTILAPAACSLASLPVIAWGKTIETGGAQHASRTVALRLWLAPVVVYVVQAVLLAVVMALLAKVYLAGAPVAARAGQLCLRLAALNLLALPLLDSGLAWRFTPVGSRLPRGTGAILTVAIVALIYRSGLLGLLEQQVVLAYFLLSRWLV